MMGASNSGGYEPLKANNSPNMKRVLEAYNSHNGMDSVIRSGECDVSIIDEVEAFTSHYGSYEVENHGSSEHLTAAQCLYRAFTCSGGQNMNSHQVSYQTSVNFPAKLIPKHECPAGPLPKPLLKYEGTSKPLLHDCPARCPQILTLHKVPTTTVLSKSLTITEHLL
ncbi:hypothetical protein NC651_010877 [Populus alba x Populus x berolinensis]|nr:hypothetical protein NC651_010877 [Populus alba x Populus x berolinensis]